MEEIINNQPIFNIGMLGSVSDGKSTAVFNLTGIRTQKHSNELKKNITIKPGYANLKIYKSTEDDHISNKKLSDDYKLIHHLSFIDCPGHQQLILTMLGNIDLMHGVIIVVSAAEPINTKKQLIQHLAAVKLANIKNIIICFNKLDLIKKEVALERKKELNQLLKKLEIIPKIIIPTSFAKNLGVENLLKSVIKYFKMNTNKIVEKNPIFKVSRSFDINKNGTKFEDVTGGVIGGSLIFGKLKPGDEIEIRPGIKTPKGYEPIITKIESIKTEQDSLKSIIPGGLVGLKTDIDPFYCKNDFLTGSVIGLVGKLPKSYNEITINYTLTNLFDGNWTPILNDSINLQIGTKSIDSVVCNLSPMKLKFNTPICIEEENMIIMSKKLKIVGYCFLFKD